jgi:rhamnosyltransferase
MDPADPAAAARGRCDDVTAVVVAYDPDVEALRQLLAELLLQVRQVVLVDNGSGTDVALALPGAGAPAAADDEAGIVLVRNGANLGIAAAQNLGIERALASPGCGYVLLSDDDSLPAAGMVAELRDALLQADGPAPVAAAGPVTIDLRTGAAGAVLLDQQGRRRRSAAPPAGPAGAAGVRDVGFLIASGTLIPARVLRTLGGMRGEYFIDHVDTEWCFRARAAGYRLLLAPRARLYHRLGEAVRRIRLLPSWPVPYHAPLRDYYAFRNTLLMQRDTAISVHWRFHQLLRLARFAAYYLLLGDLRMQRVRYMWLGIRHGLGRVSGRLVAGTTMCEAIPVTPLDPASPR